MLYSKSNKLILLLLLSLLVSSLAVSQEKVVSKEKKECHLKLGWTSWPPYIISGKYAPEGFQIEFIQWVAKEMNCNITYQKLTWSENLQAIENGTIDFLGRASKLAKRESYAYFSKSYRDDMLALTIRSGEEKLYPYQHLTDLLEQGFIIGILQGGYLGKEIEAIRTSKKYAKNFIQFSLESDIIVALDQKRVDGIFEAPFTIESAKKDNVFNHSFKQHPIKVLIGPLHFMFSKKTVTKETVDKFNRAMSKVKQSEVYRSHWFWTMLL